MSSIIIVDARSRDLRVFVASVTKTSGGVVLRKAAELGGIENLEEKRIDMPVFVTGAYQARSSGGFVEPIVALNHHSIQWVGGCGFGREITNPETGLVSRKGDGLRPFVKPVEGYLMPSGTTVNIVPTHRNSNRATAEAALAGLRFLAQEGGYGGKSQVMLIAEGQSDVTKAWSLTGPSSGGETTAYSRHPEFPDEWSERFSNEAIAEKLSLGLSRGSETAQVFRLALATAVAKIEKDFWGWASGFVMPYLGIDGSRYSAFIAGASVVFQRKQAEGWKVACYREEEAKCTVGVRKDSGEFTFSLDLGRDGLPAHYALEDKLLDVSSMDEESKAAYRAQRRADLLRFTLSRPLREGAEEYEIRHHEAITGAAAYRLFPIRSLGDWKFAQEGEGISAQTMDGLWENPDFVTLANASDYVFVVAYDVVNGRAIAGQYVAWGDTDYSFGWYQVRTNIDMIPEIPEIPSLS